MNHCRMSSCWHWPRALSYQNAFEPDLSPTYEPLCSALQLPWSTQVLGKHAGPSSLILRNSINAYFCLFFSFFFLSSKQTIMPNQQLTNQIQDLGTQFRVTIKIRNNTHHHRPVLGAGEAEGREESSHPAAQVRQVGLRS